MILNKQSMDQWLGCNEAHVRHGNANATKHDFLKRQNHTLVWII